MNRLKTEELKEMKDRQDDFLLVNTLDEDQFAPTRIPDAINIPQAEDSFIRRVEQAAGNKQRTIVVYCASARCDSSSTAAKKLAAAGFSAVYDYEAGAAGWQEAGYSLESD